MGENLLQLSKYHEQHLLIYISGIVCCLIYLGLLLIDLTTIYRNQILSIWISIVCLLLLRVLALNHLMLLWIWFVYYLIQCVTVYECAISTILTVSHAEILAWYALIVVLRGRLSNSLWDGWHGWRRKRVYVVSCFIYRLWTSTPNVHEQTSTLIQLSTALWLHFMAIMDLHSAGIASSCTWRWAHPSSKPIMNSLHIDNSSRLNFKYI
jgi:hypothetical protein